VAAPTHADAMLFMEYYKLWDTPLDGDAWATFRTLHAKGAFDDFARFQKHLSGAGRDFVLFDRVCRSFEQAGTLMKYGLLHPDLYFDAWPSPRTTWDACALVMRGLRESNPDAYANFEWLANRYDEWLAARAG
jgi:hypothetical protein